MECEEWQFFQVLFYINIDIDIYTIMDTWFPSEGWHIQFKTVFTRDIATIKQSQIIRIKMKYLNWTMAILKISTIHSFIVHCMMLMADLSAKSGLNVRFFSEGKTIDQSVRHQYSAYILQSHKMPINHFSVVMTSCYSVQILKPFLCFLPTCSSLIPGRKI